MIAFLLDNLLFLGYLCAGAFAALFLLFAFLAPFESLLWWKNLKIEPTKFVKKLKKYEEIHKNTTSDLFIVYLSGIGVISGEGLEENERRFIKKLHDKFPHAVIISDIFPYSPQLKTLSSDKFFSGLWKYLEKNRLTNKKNILDLLVNLRNFMQVAVCSDNRYAPMYNLGTTSLILEGLLKNGYDLKNQKPICFIGYSGGAQIALGATSYLSNIITEPISLIAIAGAMSDDPAIDKIAHIDYLYSSTDPVHYLTTWMYFGRMPISVFSRWNQAKAEKIITTTNLGHFKHFGDQGYFDYLHTMPHTTHTYFDTTMKTLFPLVAEKSAPQNFTQAVHAIRAGMHDGERYLNQPKNTILLSHGKKTEHVIIMLHGYTNSPPQFQKLGALFYQKGYTVYIPRIPFHAYKKQYEKQLGNMTEGNLFTFLTQTIERARQLGTHVHIMGLSLGGVLATYAAQNNPHLDSAFIISPFLRAHILNQGMFALTRFLPNIYVPSLQVPLGKNSNAYDIFSIKGLGEILAIGNMVLDQAKEAAPKTKQITFFLNESDDAVDNTAVYSLAKAWQQQHYTPTIYAIPKGIAPFHDIIDPTQKDQNTTYIYPLILDLFFQKT